VSVPANLIWPQPALPTFGSRALVLVLVSLIAVTWTNVAGAIYWFHPWKYCLGQMAYGMGAGVVMAVVTAAIVKPAEVRAGAPGTAK
jgi:hypothetical protein